MAVEIPKGSISAPGGYTGGAEVWAVVDDSRGRLTGIRCINTSNPPLGALVTFAATRGNGRGRQFASTFGVGDTTVTSTSLQNPSSFVTVVWDSTRNRLDLDVQLGWESS